MSDKTEVKEAKKLKVITKEELSKHGEKADTKWIVVEGRVIDVTIYQYEHPGGSDILMESAGKDATEQFANAGHTDGAKAKVFEHVIGILEGHDESTPIKVLAPSPKKAQAANKQAGGFNFGMLIAPIVILGAILYMYFGK